MAKKKKNLLFGKLEDWITKIGSKTRTGDNFWTIDEAQRLNRCINLYGYAYADGAGVSSGLGRYTSDGDGEGYEVGNDNGGGGCREAVYLTIDRSSELEYLAFSVKDLVDKEN